MHLRTLPCIITAITLLVSCHKDPVKPATPPAPPPADTTKTPAPPAIGTMNINLVNTGLASSVAYELVISEPGGKVLLDTVARYQTAVKAALKTNATLVDLTTVDTNRTLHNITIYKGVNPSTWLNIPIAYSTMFSQSPYPSATNATAYFTNPPSGVDLFLYTYFANGKTSIPIGGNSSIVIANYPRHPGLYNYLSFLNLGLYKLYIPKADVETVDLTHMDTANMLNFTRPPSWSTSWYYLFGVTDSTDRNKDIELSDDIRIGQTPKADVIYPKEHMQAYEMMFWVSDPDNNYYGFYSWDKTIPANPLFLEASYINVTDKSNDNFAVSFGGPVSSYHADFTDQTTVFLSVYSTPDSTSLHPITTLNNQKCRWLSGVNYGGAKLGDVWLERAPGFTYPTYIQDLSDSTKVQTHQLKSSSYILKSY